MFKLLFLVSNEVDGSGNYFNNYESWDLLKRKDKHDDSRNLGTVSNITKENAKTNSHCNNLCYVTEHFTKKVG